MLTGDSGGTKPAGDAAGDAAGDSAAQAVVSTDRKVAAQLASKAATASKSKTPAPPRVAVPAAVMQRLFAAVAGGDTAAMLAVLQRHASSLQLDVSGEPSGQGLLPLHVASQAGHVAVAAALLDRGADPDAVALVSAQAATLCVCQAATLCVCQAATLCIQAATLRIPGPVDAAAPRGGRSILTLLP